ncbi:MAG: aminodeoxychorismate/anthranilate synthase component II [Candidatus Kerfeldbacteria bacterium]|nr:aminodeoxychorismate/anthranilate synthase component II [Candidatus Kerfeldbacteria bacterium]
MKIKKNVILIDNFDSFTYNLVDYLRQFGATVTVFRNTTPVAKVKQTKPDLVVYSPGPGNPSQSGHLLEYIKAFTGVYPQFGVCLGLQAMVEACGGSLKVLDKPMHGKPSLIKHDGGTIFTGLPNPLTVGRYHSLAADRVPAEFVVSARSLDDDQVMAIRHQTLPMEAVQFHPESILTAKDGLGLQLIHNVLEVL